MRADIEAIAAAELANHTFQNRKYESAVGRGAHDPCSHVANAHRIKQHFGDELLFVEGLGWHSWTPPWRANESGANLRAQSLGHIIAAEAGALGDWVAQGTSKEERERRQYIMDRRFKWAGQSESANCIASSLHLAQPLLSCTADALDANPYLLGMPGEVLDLKTSRGREHLRGDMITKVAGCDFDPDAKAPTWEAFIAEIMAGDVDLIDYLQRLCGYLMSGVRGEHILPIFWGGGANGKSTLLGALQAMLGEFATGASPDLLLQRGGNEHPTAMADMQGRRLVVVSESGEAGRLNEERVKLLTGGDTITARRMRMDYFTFKPTHQLIMQTNHKPHARGTDEGLWRRLKLILFNVTIPADRRDSALPEKLKAELPGIMAWAVRGWTRFQKQGFNVPAAIRVATSGYRDESDVLAAFLSEVCVVNPTYTVMVRELYVAYVTWCSSSGERSLSKKDFGKNLGDRGLEQKKSTGGLMRWRGVGLQSGESGQSGVELGISTQENSLLENHSENHSTYST